MPWLRWFETGGPRAAGVAARWSEHAEGSGAMAAALDEGALDVAMLLTEGAVAGIGRGGRFRIASLYTRSPLLWGIHVPAASDLTSIEDLRGARYAISRFGSGSHLMVHAHARSRGWSAERLAFEVVGGLEGAIAAFEEGRADAFLWEKFMTQPVVDAGRFRRIGEFAAPWPAFVVCASVRAWQEKRSGVQALLEQVLPLAAALPNDSGAAAEVARRYGLRERDAAKWLAATQWADAPGIDASVIEPVAAALTELGLLDGERAPASFIT